MRRLNKLFLLIFVLNVAINTLQAQIVSKDSVSFSEDFTKTTLFLAFNQALSQDTVYSSGLPFTFVFMAPLDSISIHAVNKMKQIQRTPLSLIHNPIPIILF